MNKEPMKENSIEDLKDKEVIEAFEKKESEVKFLTAEEILKSLE